MKNTLLFAILVAAVACSKKPVCETWEISRYCKSIIPDSVCVGGTTYMTIELCGKSLEKAHSGKDDIVQITPGFQGITHYIRRVK